ncbi:MAG: DUF1588 domain-containing protein, partial [Polyangiaceae bacterium]|nr:DUF1588 domain-containing protein [Polyangiaceae bacterium]
GAGSVVGGPGSGGSGNPNGSGGNGVVNPPVNLPAEGALGPVALRRLTTPEYENTVQQLLKVPAGTASTFLPDDESSGFKNMAAALRVPQAVAEQYARAAKTLAAGVASQATTLAPCADAGAEAACADSFIRQFGQQAYRRPLTTEEVGVYAKLFTDERARATYADGISIIVETMLQSPHFLYKTEIGVGSGLDRQLTQYELASQISYLATGGMPDDQLFAAAAGNQLATGAGREAQLRRLLPTATPWLRGFVLDWLGISKAVGATKDTTLFPTYDTGLHTAIVEESHRFVDSIFSEAGGSVVTLFNANWTYADGMMASHYGVSGGPTGTDWAKVTLPGERMGILTQAAFLTAHSKINDSFPITRGKILRTRVMCTAMPPPPPGLKIDPVAPPSATATTRERINAHSTNPTCASCHTLIDPLGFGLENYDAVGAYRAVESGKPVDSSGEVKQIDPEVDGPFANGIELVGRIAGSQVLKNCVSREAFRWGTGRVSLDPVTDTTSPDYPKYLRDKGIIDAMMTKMVSTNADMRELLTALVGNESYAYRSDK